MLYVVCRHRLLSKRKIPMPMALGPYRVFLTRCCQKLKVSPLTFRFRRDLRQVSGFCASPSSTPRLSPPCPMHSALCSWHFALCPFPYALCLVRLAFILSPFTFHLLPFTFYLSPFTFHLSPFSFYLLPFTFVLFLHHYRFQPRLFQLVQGGSG